MTKRRSDRKQVRRARAIERQEQYDLLTMDEKFERARRGSRERDRIMKQRITAATAKPTQSGAGESDALKSSGRTMKKSKGKK